MWGEAVDELKVWGSGIIAPQPIGKGTPTACYNYAPAPPIFSLRTMSTTTQILCEFLSSITYDQLPAEVIQHAKLSILNVLGCGINSASASPSQIARRAVLPLSNAMTNTLLARPEKVDVQTAALLNGIAFTTADYDDTHLETVIHPSGTVVAAILAWGELRNISGKDIILAFVVGLEALLRVGLAISPGNYTIGWYSDFIVAN
jgi:aconitate decarboxylase